MVSIVCWGLYARIYRVSLSTEPPSGNACLESLQILSQCQAHLQNVGKNVVRRKESLDFFGFQATRNPNP